MSANWESRLCRSNCPRLTARSCDTLPRIRRCCANSRCCSRGERAILPASIRLADYPQLRLLAWSRDPGLRTITAEDALALYERNWRFVDPSSLTRKEAALIRRLAERAGTGTLHVPGIGLP